MGEQQKQRTCFCCGKAYHFCPNCAEDADKPSWYFIFDSENCKNIFNICQRFSTNAIDAQSAAQELDKCDLTNKTDFLPDVQKVIKKIYRDCRKTSRSSASSKKTVKE